MPIAECTTKDIDAALAESTPTSEPPPGVIVAPAFERFPIEALPPVMSRLTAQAAASIDIDQAMVGPFVLGACAGVIGGHVACETKYTHTEPCILWIGVVAGSGTGKSPAFDMAVDPLRELQSDLFREHKEIAESGPFTEQDDEKRTEPSRLLIDDTTPEAAARRLSDNPRGLTKAVDELGGHFKGIGEYKRGRSGDQERWIQFYNGKPATIDRVSGDKKTIHVPRAAITVFGGVQPSTLERVIGQEEIDSGMAARFMFAAPPCRPVRWSESSPDRKVIADYRALIHRLWRTFAAPRTLTLSPEAQRRYVEFYDSNADMIESLDGTAPGLCEALSKFNKHCPRIATVIQCVRHVSEGASGEVVEEESMRSAIRIAEWFRHEAVRLYQGFGQTDDREMSRLLDYIRSRGGRITESQLQRGPRRYRKPGAAKAALADLVDRGYCDAEWAEPDIQGGRPSKVYWLLRGDETPREGVVSPVAAPVMATTGDRDGHLQTEGPEDLADQLD